jgi:hypothetical protein
MSGCCVRSNDSCIQLAVTLYEATAASDTAVVASSVLEAAAYEVIIALPR